MKSKQIPFFMLAILVAVLPACSPGLIWDSRIKTGSTQTFTLNEPFSTADEVQNVNLSMTVGEIHLAGGAQSLLEGEVRYNVADWKPVVRSSHHSLTVSQGDRDQTIVGFSDGQVVNVWDVRLGDAPLNLTVYAAANDAILDLSGIPLQRLNVQNGASNSEIRFDTLNPEKMQSLNYEGGMSDVTFRGLANANFARMTFDAGIGDYTFDFSGDLQRDATVKITAGMSDVTILVPEGIFAKVFVNHGPATVSARDAWTPEDGYYLNEGSGSQLTITVDIGAGNLRLINQ